MPTLFLQLVVGFLEATFGVLSIRVSSTRAIESLQPRMISAWLLTGYAFTVGGVLFTLQSFWAAWAYFAGAESSVFQLYLRWMPMGNNARTVSITLFGLLLAGVGLIRSPLRLQTTHRLGWVIAGSAAIGAVTGWSETRLDAVTYFSSMAVGNLVQLIILLAALFIVLWTAAVDRLLWFALAVHAFKEALHVLWVSALTARDTPGAWSPSPFQIQAYSSVLWALMVLVVLRCLTRVRAGRAVPTLLDSLRSRSSLVA